MIPICGYCSHYTKDEDFPELFGTCEFKTGRYSAFRANGCDKWEIKLSFKNIEEELTRYRL